MIFFEVKAAYLLSFSREGFPLVGLRGGRGRNPW